MSLVGAMQSPKLARQHQKTARVILSEKSIQSAANTT